MQKINRKFSELKKTLEESLKTKIDKKYWQTTPIIGYQETVYKKGGVIIIGINENDINDMKRSKANANCPNKEKDSIFTGETRDKVLGCYRYFTFFTKKEILSSKFDCNIKFMELIPIKTKKGNELKKHFSNNYDDIKKKCYGNLREMLKLLDPELIIVNSVEVSDLFKQQKSKERDGNQKEKETNLKINISDNKVPVILSGQITGMNGLDRYNKIRFWKEIEGVVRNYKCKERKQEN